MDLIFYQGTEETAPVCIAIAGSAPGWHGKSRAALRVKLVWMGAGRKTKNRRIVRSTAKN